MHRLLQGDVGAGKTVVAVGALLAAVQGGHQGALMAPTEVLAEQHFLGIRALLAGLDGAGRRRRHDLFAGQAWTGRCASSCSRNRTTRGRRAASWPTRWRRARSTC